MKIVNLEEFRKLPEGIRELNGEYQEGWEGVITKGETLLNIFREESKLNKI